MQNMTLCGVLITALFVLGCDSGARQGAPNGGRGDNATGVPGGTPGGDAAPPLQPPEQATDDSAPPEQPRETVPEQPAQDEPAAGEAETSLTVPADATTLLLLPWEEIQQHITNNLQGKVVVVDLWATYCVPCRESFPGLVALSQQDPDNIACVSVSLDDPEDEEKRTEVVQFLEEQQATFTNFLCTTDTDELYDEILKIGGVPAVYVYGRDGEVAKVFNGPTPEGTDHTYDEHITPFVTELAAGG